jgi:predicted nucleic acid-binding protein
MKLVDTSAWIHSLRPDGDPAVAERVRAALESGEATWCAMVRLELWNGARGDREKKVLRDMEATLSDLPITDEVWQLAMQLAQQARAKGWTVPATDLLVAACAQHHEAGLEHADSHFDQIASLS